MANFAIEMPGIFFLYIYIYFFFMKSMPPDLLKITAPPPPPPPPTLLMLNIPNKINLFIYFYIMEVIYRTKILNNMVKDLILTNFVSD